MENAITPQQVEDAAVKARVPLYKFLANAGVSRPTFYRWKENSHKPRALTLAKLADAVRDA